jgi:hypothetical protein
MHISPDNAVEIPIPRSEFPSDFRTPSSLKQEEMHASEASSRLRTEQDTPVIHVESGTSTAPLASVERQEPRLIPQLSSHSVKESVAGMEKEDFDFVPEGKKRVWCNQCEMISINGLPCHETGCPNERKLWNPLTLPLFVRQDPDREYGEWVDRTPELANGLESDMASPVEAGTNNAKSGTTSRAGRALIVDDEEPQLVLPFISRGTTACL